MTQPDALFRAAADQAPQVMWIVNAKGAVTYLNHSWYELVGGMPPKWYGHEWGDVVEPEDLAEMRARWKAASATGSIFEGTRRVKAQDGTWHTLSYKATPVFDAGGLVCWVGMDSDITELKATEAALRYANQELEAFSYSVSHDLRTPLVTVQGFVRLLGKQLEAIGDTKVRHYLSRITEAVDHMGRLVDGLLALSHVTRRKLEYEDVDLSRMANEVLGMLQQSQPQRAVAITVQPGLRARADARLMAALLENLLGNAWKFTSATAHAEISVGMEKQTKAEAVFFVRDNGAGFEMAHAAQLFNAFERLHAASEFPGMGIGLATVARVLARHGGRAWAESEPGKGARFYFSLPRM
ncbi:PAS domain-containing sensor histidine kinase [Caenimonas soli]|uniref:PAS domain-containing sensor histidine kinase n=1 Tax=Caenimonas soli TaxID=2735555 RepID=UPI0015559408|nr:ATP-binding protein [Caenimonas soli]NPC54810.1 PAS domain S-box protein [Caenimonas soli]